LSVLYTVRCRFTRPSFEDAWNEWYVGHIRVLLSVPGFVSAQRFHCSSTVDDRPYLAMYEVAGPEVFTSDPYRAIWGFDEWRPLIDNWTRDISTARGPGAINFATPANARLWAGFVSGGDACVEAALDALSTNRPFVQTVTVTGLDRSCTAIAWEVLGDPGNPGPAALARAGIQIAQAVYTPLTECLAPTATSRGDRG
jgi:hypothetical protein